MIGVGQGGVEMLDNFKNGASVKIIYTYEEYEEYKKVIREKELKGLLYRDNPTSNSVVLISNTILNNSNRFNRTPNMLSLRVSGIKDIASTRFKKEVSAVLNEQYKNVIELQKVKRELEKLTQLQNKLNKDIEKNSVELFNVMSQSNLKDMTSWNERLKRDFSSRNQERKYESYTSLSYYFRKLVNKGQFAEITLGFCLEREERLLSKELEDRIIRGDSVSKNDVQNYTPKIDKLNQVFKGKAVMSQPKKSNAIQDKGWVSFYLDTDLTFKVDLREYDNWYQQITSYINKYFPPEVNSAYI